MTGLPSLTARQREFLRALLALWRERVAAIHYTELAQRMGVSRFSAYDMLRVFERLGLVKATYVLAHSGSLAGRSSVLYTPTERALALMGQESADEWQEFRGRLLNRIRERLGAGLDSLIDDLLARIPERLPPLQYCSEVITAQLLNLEQARQKISGFNALDALRSLTSPAGESALGVLAGLSLGAGARDENVARSQQLFDHTRRYQALLREVGEDGTRKLAEFLQDAMDILAGRSHESVSDSSGGSQ
jgi:energy-coupling factor transport system substrate-specific component